MLVRKRKRNRRKSLSGPSKRLRRSESRLLQGRRSLRMPRLKLSSRLRNRGKLSKKLLLLLHQLLGQLMLRRLRLQLGLRRLLRRLLKQSRPRKPKKLPS